MHFFSIVEKNAAAAAPPLHVSLLYTFTFGFSENLFKKSKIIFCTDFVKNSIAYDLEKKQDFIASLYRDIHKTNYMLESFRNIRYK